MMDAVYIAEHGTRKGPYSPEEFKQAVQDGKITRDTLVWVHESKSWRQAREFKEFENAFVSERSSLAVATAPSNFPNVPIVSRPSNESKTSVLTAKVTELLKQIHHSNASGVQSNSGQKEKLFQRMAGLVKKLERADRERGRREESSAHRMREEIEKLHHFGKNIIELQREMKETSEAFRDRTLSQGERLLKQSELDESKSCLAAMAEEKKNLEKYLSHLKEQSFSLETRLENLVEDEKKKREKIEKFQKEMMEEQKKSFLLKEQLMRQTHLLGKAKQILHARQLRGEKLLKTVKILEEKKERYKKEIKLSFQKNKEAEIENKTFSQELFQSKKEVQRLRSTRASMQEELGKLQEDVSHYHGRLAAVQGSIEGYNQQLHTYTVATREGEEKMKGIEAQVFKREAYLENLETRTTESLREELFRREKEELIHQVKKNKNSEIELAKLKEEWIKEQRGLLNGNDGWKKARRELIAKKEEMKDLDKKISAMRVGIARMRIDNQQELLQMVKEFETNNLEGLRSKTASRRIEIQQLEDEWVSELRSLREVNDRWDAVSSTLQGKALDLEVASWVKEDGKERAESVRS